MEKAFDFGKFFGTLYLLKSLIMRHLHKFIGIFILAIIVYACSSPADGLKQKKEEEKPVVIANDSLEYEVIIFDVGFNNFLASRAKPRGFYTKSYMENWNQIYVINWNMRAQNPLRFNANIYGNIINYDRNIDYGFEVNYKLFNYFQFAQQKYNMRLDGGTGRPIRIRSF